MDELAEQLEDDDVERISETARRLFQSA